MNYTRLNKLSGPVWYLLSVIIYGFALWALYRVAIAIPPYDQGAQMSIVEWQLVMYIALVPLSGFLAVTWYQRTHTKCNVYEWEYWQKLVWAQRYLLMGLLIAIVAVYAKIKLF